MSENLRDKIADAILANFNPPDDKHGSWWINPGQSADAVLAVVGPELDRLRAEVAASRAAHLADYGALDQQIGEMQAECDALRAEVERLRQGIWDMCIQLGMDSDGDATPAHLRYPDIVTLGLQEAARMKSDYETALDEAIAFEAERDVLRDRLAKVATLADWWAANGGTGGYEAACHDHARHLRAALASVPEPSDTEAARKRPAHDRLAAAGADLVEVDPAYSEPAPDADREVCDLCGVSEATGWHDGHCDTCCRRDGHAPDADREAVPNIGNTCCGKCPGGTCYVDGVTGA